MYVFPHVGRAEWVILENDDQTYGNRAADLVALAKIESSPHWQLVFTSQGIQVFQRRAAGG